MIRLNCFGAAKEGRFDEALAAAKVLVESSVKEDGCVAYDVFTSATRPGVIIICETWRDENALAAHSATDTFKKCIGVLSETCPLKIEKFNF